MKTQERQQRVWGYCRLAGPTDVGTLLNQELAQIVTEEAIHQGITVKRRWFEN